jgi:hypothetical protein
MLLASFKKQPLERLATVLAAAIVTVLVWGHPQPWPYLFVMCMPFLALVAPAALVQAPQPLKPLLILVTSVLLSQSFTRNVAVLAHDNRQQLEVVERVEALLAPEDRYFDGIAMIPTRRIAGEFPWWWWDAPTVAELRAQIQSGQPSHALSIITQGPKVWILNYRLQRFDDFIGSFLALGTLRIDDYILVSGRAIAPGEQTHFRNLWSGSYDLIDSNGERRHHTLLVDDVACDIPCRIGAGDHRVRSTAVGWTFLLPADVRPDRPLPIRNRALELFADVYDF